MTTLRCLLPSHVDWNNVPRWRKYAMVVWAVLETATLSGIVFGFYSLVYVLKDEGIYGELCVGVGESENGTDTTGHRRSRSLVSQSSGDSLELANRSSFHGMPRDCSAQDSQLALAFTIATGLLPFGSLSIGHVQDIYGVRASRIIIMVVYVTGAVSLALVGKDHPWLLFVGTFCIGFVSMPLLISNLQVANMFGGGSAMVIALLSGSFDASSSVQVLIKTSYERGIPRQTSFLALALASLVILSISTFILLPKMHIPKPLPLTRHKDDRDKSAMTDEATLFPTLYSVYTSPIYLAQLFWLGLLRLRFYLYISSFNTWLEYTTDHDAVAVSHFTNVSMYVQFAGIVTAPFIGILLDLEAKRHRKRDVPLDRLLLPSFIPLVVTSSLAVLMSGLVLITQPTVLYLVFVVFTIFRSFVFGLAASYVQMIFPGKYFGRAYGAMGMAASIMSLLQYAFVVWIGVPPRGPAKVNVCMLAVACLSYVQPVYVWITCLRARRRDSNVFKETSPSQTTVERPML